MGTNFDNAAFNRALKAQIERDMAANPERYAGLIAAFDSYLATPATGREAAFEALVGSGVALARDPAFKAGIQRSE